MLSYPKCPKCKSNKFVVKYGKRHNQSGAKQTYFCKKCECRFTPKDGFWKMRFSPEVITAALDLYYKGLSLRKIKDHLYNIEVSHTSILRWVRRYAKLTRKYTMRYKPKIKGNIHTDEIFLEKKEDDRKYLYFFDAIDSETRFFGISLIFRDGDSAKELFKRVKHNGEGYPKKVVHDGFHPYEKAFRKYFYHKSEEVRLVKFEDKVNNNIVERLQGTIRERNKVQRGLSSYSSSFDTMEGVI